MTVKIFKIQHRVTKLFSTGTAYPRWSNKGKTWDNRNSLSSHMSLVGSKDIRSKYKDADIIEFELTPKETVSCADYADIMERNYALRRKYGTYFTDLVTKLEKANTINDYRWLIALHGYMNEDRRKQIAKSLKDLGIKKTEIRSTQNCYAFRDRSQAMLFKLGLGESAQSFDLTTLEELQNV